MNLFLKKILSKSPLVSADWDLLLKQSHRVEPGMTSAGFGGRNSVNHLDSYGTLVQNLKERLAEVEFGRPLRILDLACGDGHLLYQILQKLPSVDLAVGLDFSDEELALASNTCRAAIQSGRAEFLFGDARQMPFPDAHFGAVTSHMALMLMHPFELVRNEILRVLQPGGVLVALIASQNSEGHYAETLDVLHQFFKANDIDWSPSKQFREARLNSVEGWRELFPLSDFEILEFRKIQFEFAFTAEETWELFRPTYMVAALPPDLKIKCEQTLKAFADSKKPQPGQKFEYPMMMIAGKRKKAAEKSI